MLDFPIFWAAKTTDFCVELFLLTKKIRFEQAEAARMIVLQD
jgi:hypothetical protein